MQTKFKVGDLVVGYHKGIWRITKIERRFYTAQEIDRYKSFEGRKVGEEYNPLVHYELVMYSNLTPGRKITKRCDASYCRRIDQAWINEQRKELERQEAALIKLEIEIENQADHGTTRKQR